MSFGFGGAQTQSGGGSCAGAQASQGPDLEQIDTEQLSFHSISGEDQLRLLPSPWPNDSLPPASASLLSVASSKGLVAAAGPDILVVAKTESIRKTFAEAKAASKTIDFTPEATISVPRVSQVAFSSDESCLVVVAEQGGRLAVYDTNALTSGDKAPAFQISTNGVGVRQLLPNPNPSSDLSHLFGVVLQTGQLLLADLKSRALSNNSSGNSVFLENVTSACWSRLGKQIVAGRSDGTAAQIDPTGTVKAEIPVPPKLPELAGESAGQMALMSIYWLDTSDFLLIHTPANAPSRGGMSDDMPADSVFHVARRENARSSNWTFQNLIDPAPGLPMGGRTPAHHFIQRLKDWPPDLDDLLLSISTSSTDVGMITKASAPLKSATPVVGAFATTMPPDTHRAGMPLSEADRISDTSPIGMGIDLSSNALIQKPIPNDAELAESPVPLPALYILNNEGILRVWYIAYSASVRQNITFPDLLAAGGPRPLGEQKKENSAASRPTSSAGSTSVFGGMAPPKQPASIASPGLPSFGTPNTPAFGGSSGLGNRASPWGAPTASGATSPAPKGPAFGSSTPLGGGGGFGQVGGIGQKQSPWGAPAQPPSLGKPSTPFGGNAAPQSPFAASAFGGNKAGEQKPTSGTSVFGGGQPAATFGGFGAGQKENKPSAFASSPFASSPFGQKPAVPADPSFGSTATLGTGSSFGGGSTIVGSSLFGTPSQNGSASFGKPSAPTSREETMGDDTETPTKPAEDNKPASGFSFGNSVGFKLGSTFKGDGSAKDDLPKPKDSGSSFFGGGFCNALGEVEKKADEQPVTPVKKEPGMEESPKLQDIPAASTTPAGPPKQDDPLIYKPKRFAGDLPPMDVSAEKQDDPLSYKPKRFAGDVPPVEDALSEKPQSPAEPKREDEALLAGSPLIGLGNERFSEAAGSEAEVPAGPEDEDDEWSEEDEDGEANEEHDQDDEDADDEEDSPSDHEVTDPSALSAFEARIHPASSKRSEQQEEESTTPATERKPALPSFTPAGLPKHNINFAPPAQESPRSPSPVRSVTAPMQQKPTFGAFAQPFTAKPQAAFGQPSKQPPTQAQPQQIAVPAVKLANSAERPAAPAKPAEPTAGDLEDEEDARIQAIINSQPEPTKELPAFLAHQDYYGQSQKEGIGGQIEKVYRDINSMIDTLALNAHSLQGFVDGHLQLEEPGRRTVEDLEQEDVWTLDEGDELARLQVEIGDKLEAGRLDDVQGMLEDLQEEEQEVLRLKTKTADLRKRIKSHTNPNQMASQLAAPLSAEAQGQQSELRQGVQRVQKLLGQVEEATSLLRADLASAASADATANGAVNVPTVEAVTNTILKMTAMIEQRSGDIDVLESQIRRLPGGIASLKLNEDYEDQLVASLMGSKLLNDSASSRTPPVSKSRMLANGEAPGMSGILGSRYRTPPSQHGGRRSLLFSPEASRLGMSTGSMSGSARKKMVDVTDAEVQAYHATSGPRKRVLSALRNEVEKKGVRSVSLEG